MDELQSQDEHLRKSAKSQISSFLFLKTDLPLIYKSIQQTWDDDDDTELSTRAELIEVLGGVFDEQTPGVLLKLYPNLPQNPLIQAKALRALAQIGTGPSLQHFSQLILKHKPDLKGREAFVFAPLYNLPEQLSLLYPRLLELTQKEAYQYPVYELLTVGFAEKSLKAAALKPYANSIIKDYKTSRQKRANLSVGSESYLQVSPLVHTLVKCLAYFPQQDSVKTLLQTILKKEVPDIQLVAATTCLSENIPLPDSSIFSQLAANKMTRIQFYVQLEQMGKVNLFPKKWLTQEAFAESELVEWLSVPNKRNGPPTQITLVKKHKLADEGNLYLFKFVYPGGGWMAGISGPQPSDTTQINTVGYLTNSEFRKWEDLNPDKHIELLVNP